MDLKISNKYLCWFGVFCIFLLGAIVQANMFLNFDVSWLLKATNKLLLGGHYYLDFIETNPPLILYIYSPAILLAKLCNISVVLAFRIYMFLMILCLIILCNYLLKKMFVDKSSNIRYALLFAMSFAFILLPAFSFGERDHISIMLTLPYFLLVSLRLYDKRVKVFLLCYIGLLAGIGFSIKPYFLFAFIFTELYLMYIKRNFFQCFRIETFTIGSFVLLYLSSIFILTPNYIFKVWPLVYHLYFAGIQESWINVFSKLAIVFWFITVGFYCFLYENIKYKYIINLLLFASIGYFISYFIQHTDWYYHILPAYTLTILMAVVLLFETMIYIQEQNEKKCVTWNSLILIVCLIVSIFCFPILDTMINTKLGFQNVKTVYSEPAFQYIKNNANKKPIFVFTISIPIVSSFVDYSQAIWASRFPSVVFISGMIEVEKKSKDSKVKLQKFLQLKNEINELMLEDFVRYKPKFIIVDKRKINVFPLKKSFDFIRYFAQDVRFKKLFAQYRKIKTFPNYAVYTY